MATQHRGFKITVLINKDTMRKDLKTEHGLAFHVEYASGAGIFDTGASDLFIRNATNMGLNLFDLSWVALSHGHHDHTGGLDALLQMKNDMVVYASPEIFAPKFSHRPGDEWRPIGMSMTREEVQKNAGALKLNENPVEIAPGIRLTGLIGKGTPYEMPNDHFFTTNRNRKVPDLFPDEQALLLQTEMGSVVLMGCSHSGVINTLQYVRHITDGEPLLAAIGGMHLDDVPNEVIKLTVDAIRELDVQIIAPMHCTGDRAVKMLEENFPDRFVNCPIGKTLEF